MTINKIKTIQMLRNNLRGMFDKVERLQLEKNESTFNPQRYINIDNQIGEIRSDIDTMKDLIRYLDEEEKPAV